MSLSHSRELSMLRQSRPLRCIPCFKTYRCQKMIAFQHHLPHHTGHEDRALYHLYSDKLLVKSICNRMCLQRSLCCDFRFPLKIISIRYLCKSDQIPLITSLDLFHMISNMFWQLECFVIFCKITKWTFVLVCCT